MASRPNDDLFEGSKMSFGQHLEELRVILFRALIGLVFGMVVGLFVAKDVVRFIQTPLTAALEDYALERAIDKLAEQYKNDASPEMMVAMTELGVVPTVSSMELNQLLEALSRFDPELTDDIRFKLYRFVRDDFLVDKDKTSGQQVNKTPAQQVNKISGRLVSDGEGKDGTPGKLLWSLMTPEQQQFLQELSKKIKASDDEIKKLVSLLNELADNPKVHQSDEFSKLSGPKKSEFSLFDVASWVASETTTDKAFREQINQLREQLKDKAGEKIDSDQSRRLNRILMTTAFPELFRRPRVILVDMPTWKPIEIRVQALGAQEAFMIWLKAGLISALILTSPWIFWQVWMFVASGLYPHEKRYVHIFLPFSLLLFLSGTALAFFFVFKPVLSFLFSFNAMMDIDPDPRIGEWMSFVLFLPLGFGIAFQLPLVMLFLNRIGLFTIEMYLEKWRIAVLVIFVISMILTPADPISMLLMAMPLTILYFLGVALCKWMPRGRSLFDETEAYEP